MTESVSSSTKVRIAVVIPTHWEFRMGGSQYQAKLLIEKLYSEYGAKIAYFTARAPDVRQYADHQVICVGRDDFLRKYGHFWDYFRLQKALQEFAPDVIYQRVSCSYTGIAARFSDRFGVPLVWHVASENDCRRSPTIWKSLRRPHAWLESTLSKRGVLRADVILAQTEDQIQMLEANFGRRANKLIRNFHPIPDVPKKRSDRLTVVWIANFKPLKRPELFLEVAALLKDLAGIEFLMVGQPYSSGTVQAEFERKIRQVPNVKCLGAMPQDDVNALLEKAHVLVNTSRWEGFSNTFIQAWMRAVPVLTVGVNPDGLLDSGALGRSLTSAEEIAMVIREFVTNPDMLEAMGKQARELAIREFSMQNAAELAELLVAITETRTGQRN